MYLTKNRTSSSTRLKGLYDAIDFELKLEVRDRRRDRSPGSPSSAKRSPDALSWRGSNRVEDPRSSISIRSQGTSGSSSPPA